MDLSSFDAGTPGNDKDTPNQARATFAADIELVNGMLLLPVLSLGFVPFHPTGGGAGVALTMTVWLLEAAVACVGALVYRRRAAKAARSGSADQPEG